MYQVRIESGFEAAHFLPEYNGKCENLHGHNYRVRIYARGNQLDRSGMLFDFTELKKEVKKTISKLDHTLLNKVPFFERKAPSAENIAFFIFHEVTENIKLPKNVAITQVDVFETEQNLASYFPSEK